jgi:hypothetical protein
MNTLYGIAKQILQYGWNHPGLLVVAGVVGAAVGVITWRKSKEN